MERFAGFASIYIIAPLFMVALSVPRNEQL